MTGASWRVLVGYVGGGATVIVAGGLTRLQAETRAARERERHGDTRRITIARVTS